MIMSAEGNFQQACFWGLKTKHFWLRGCGPSLYMYTWLRRERERERERERGLDPFWPSNCFLFPADLFYVLFGSLLTRNAGNADPT